MLVGGGNAFDAVDVKPRLACKLAQIPALDVSPEAGLAPLQVQATTSNSPTHYGVGALGSAGRGLPRRQAEARDRQQQRRFAEPAGPHTRSRRGNRSGYKVTTLQEKPTFVTNFRPYMEQLRTSGAKAYDEIASQDPTPRSTRCTTSATPPRSCCGTSSSTTRSRWRPPRRLPFPPSYVALAALPAELVDDYPVLQQIRSIMNAGVTKTEVHLFHRARLQRLDAVGEVCHRLRCRPDASSASSPRPDRTPTGTPADSSPRTRPCLAERLSPRVFC